MNWDVNFKPVCWAAYLINVLHCRILIRFSLMIFGYLPVGWRQIDLIWPRHTTKGEDGGEDMRNRSTVDLMHAVGANVWSSKHTHWERHQLEQSHRVCRTQLHCGSCFHFYCRKKTEIFWLLWDTEMLLNQQPRKTQNLPKKQSIFCFVSLPANLQLKLDGSVRVLQPRYRKAQPCPELHG